MPPRIPPQLQDIATRWLTERLLQSKLFVNTIESGHRFVQDVRDGMLEDSTRVVQKEPHRTPEATQAQSDRVRRTARSTYHADASRRAESSASSSDEKTPPERDEAEAKLQELLEKMRGGPK